LKRKRRTYPSKIPSSLPEKEKREVKKNRNSCGGHYSINTATAAIKVTKLTAPAELKPWEAIAPLGAAVELDAGLLPVTDAPGPAPPDDNPAPAVASGITPPDGDPAPAPAVAGGALPAAAEAVVVSLALLFAAALEERNNYKYSLHVEDKSLPGRPRRSCRE
jgi:hypothetical protein